MALYTERHGIRKQIERTSDISIEMFSMLLNCCKKFYENLAWKYPAQCTDGFPCAGYNYEQFRTHMKFEIPELANCFVPPERKGKCYNQYALLDLIEFVAQNCRDISNREWHDFMKHHHLWFAETNNVSCTFREEINDIFKKTGLLYVLTENLTIERVVEYVTLTSDVEESIQSVGEEGVKELLSEAMSLFKQPNPINHKLAVEKLWDALERLKTYYTNLDKKDSVAKIVKDMGSGQEEFEKLFNDEFLALTKIGNDYRIRHHETDKIEIKDLRHYDYFFNRCLALIAVALQYLQ